MQDEVGEVNSMKLATPWQRLAAAAIDFLILVIVFAFFEALFSSPDSRQFYHDIAVILETGTLGFNNTIWILGRMAEGQMGYLRLFELIFYIFYLVFLPIVWTKQTLGRWIMNLRVVKLNGRRLTPGTMTIREVMGVFLISLFTLGVTSVISIVMMFLAPARRTIHDRMSNTLVVVMK
jgi:uncharacterized RDD family membrane protein YckC